MFSFIRKGSQTEDRINELEKKIDKLKPLTTAYSFEKAQPLAEELANLYDEAGHTIQCAATFGNLANDLAFITVQREQMNDGRGEVNYDGVIRYLREAKQRFLECDKANYAFESYRHIFINMENPKVLKVMAEDMFELFKYGCDVIDAFKSRFGNDLYNVAVRLSEYEVYPLSVEIWEWLALAYEQSNTNTTVRCWDCVVVIHLHRGDVVSAEKKFNEVIQHDFFVRTDDFTMLDYIIRGVKNEDESLLELGRKSVIIQFLPPIIARFIVKLKVDVDTNGNMLDGDDEESNL